MNSIRLTVTGMMIALGSGQAFADDRAPNADERPKIEAALKADGFSTWGDIELDDRRVWEVDDARHSDGKEYDVDLDPSSFAIVKRDLD